MVHTRILFTAGNSGNYGRIRQVILRCLKYLSITTIPQSTKGKSLTINYLPPESAEVAV